MRVGPLIIMLLTLLGLQLFLVGILCQVPKSIGLSIPLAIEGEEYLVRDAYYRLDDPKIHRATSEHFQVIWGMEQNMEGLLRKWLKGSSIISSVYGMFT